MELGTVIFGLLAIVLIGKLLGLTMKLIKKLIVNGLAGFFMLFVINFFGGALGIYLPMTAFNSFMTGFLGIPWVIVMVIFRIGV